MPFKIKAFDQFNAVLLNKIHDKIHAKQFVSLENQSETMAWEFERSS